MFRGRKHLCLDTKGRMAMPAKYRDHMKAISDGKMVITIDAMKCLLIYPLPAWEAVEQKLAELPSTNIKVQEFKRYLLHNAEDCDLDNQGRMVIPSSLRAYAALEKHCVLAGQVNKLELWDESKYEQQVQVQWHEMETPSELENFSF